MMTSMEHITPIVKLNLKLCDYSDVYITVKGTITVPNTGTAAAPNNANKEVVFKNCATFTGCIS